MPISEDKKEAYKKLEEAVEAMRKAYGHNDDILTGYLLLTSSIEFVSEEDSPDNDELDLRSQNGWYSKRGQDPTLSYGILCEAVRHYNEIQVNYGDE